MGRYRSFTWARGFFCRVAASSNNTLAATGSLTLFPSLTTDYSLYCTGGGVNTATQTIRVSVIPASGVPTVSFSRSTTAPSTDTTGSVTLTWSSTNATSCTASGNWSGAKATSGTLVIYALAFNTTYNFNLSCTGAGGTTNAAPIAFTIGRYSITATPTTLAPGGSVAVSYTQPFESNLTVSYVVLYSSSGIEVSRQFAGAVPTGTTGTKSFVIASAGSYYFSLVYSSCINSAAPVGCVTSTNTVTVAAAAKSDLTISAIALSNTSMGMGGSIGVRVTLKNISTTTATQTASAISAGIYVASNAACTTGLQQVTSLTKSIVMVAAGSKLAAGASVTKPTSTTFTTVSIPSSGYSHGATVYVCVKADNNGTASNAGVESETNEVNNWFSKSISMM